MRLHELSLTAFGPFAGTERVDFDALADAGLFLIHGPTGAGKTSVLDAVCFALYGRVPGARETAKTLRSHHAPIDRVPRVELEATIRGRRIRITRSPAWTRPKKRGEGAVEEKPKVAVAELKDGTWTALTNRMDEAGQFVRGLLGMSAEQFCQLALLPQGEFARFLRAGAEERRAVLEQLFATEMFADVERWLAERRTQTGREADAARRAAESVADRITEALGDLEVEPDIAPEPPESLDELADWARRLTVAAERETEATRRREQAAATARDESAATTARARALAERQRRHAEATERAARAAEREGERTELAERIERANRAHRVVPLLVAADQRAEQAEKAVTVAGEALAAVTDLVDIPGELLVDGADSGRLTALLREADESRRGEAAALDRMRTDATRLTEVRTELAAARRRLDELDEKATARAASLAELPDQCAEAEAELTAVRAAAARVPAVEAALEKARTALEATLRRDELTGEVASADEHARTATDAAQQARDELQRVRQARLAGMAAELADGLHDGSPCPVCGGTEHPAPARATDDAPDATVEEAVAQAYETAAAARQQATQRAAELSAELAAVAKAAAGLPADAAREAVTEREAELAEALAARDAEQRHADELAALKAELDGARAAEKQTGAEIARVRTQVDGLAVEDQRLAAKLDKARGDDASIAVRIDRLTSEAGLLGDACDAIGRAATAREELEAACRSAEQAARQAGFDGSARARACALADAELASARERLRELDDEAAATRELLADPELVEAAAQDPPDLQAHENELAERTSEYTAAAAASATAQRRRARLAELAEELDRRLGEWRPLAYRHDVAVRMASLAAGTAGDNRLRMRLSAYVLAARLEQVVAAANERLDHMSAGRYMLAHSVERAVGDRRGGSGGLGLRVVDNWTGMGRDPATLSGGETFLTSLALALGLADVVGAEAGGAEIATLFVDEGFGSLDDETLDEVMDTLDGLRDGGRAVGIVSHVAELRNRVPARLAVSKARHGSTLAA